MLWGQRGHGHVSLAQGGRSQVWHLALPWPSLPSSLPVGLSIHRKWGKASHHSAGHRGNAVAQPGGDRRAEPSGLWWAVRCWYGRMPRGCTLVLEDLGEPPCTFQSQSPPGYPLTFGGPTDVVSLYQQVPRALREAVQQQKLQGGRNNHH